MSSVVTSLQSPTNFNENVLLMRKINVSGNVSVNSQKYVDMLFTGWLQ